MSLDRKFDEDFKNVLKTVIFSPQVGLTGNFVLDCSFKLSFWQLKLLHHFSFWLYWIFWCFLCHLIGNLMGMPKMCLKLSLSHSKSVLQAILSLTVLSNCLSDSSNFNTAFLPDCTQFFSVFYVMG